MLHVCLRGRVLISTHFVMTEHVNVGDNSMRKMMFVVRDLFPCDHLFAFKKKTIICSVWCFFHSTLFFKTLQRVSLAFTLILT